LQSNNKRISSFKKEQDLIQQAILEADFGYNDINKRNMSENQTNADHVPTFKRLKHSESETFL